MLASTRRPRLLRHLLSLIAATCALAFLLPTATAAAAPTPESPDRPVGMAKTATGKGYWIANSTGGVYTFGDAGYHGSMGGKPLNAPVVAVAATPTGKGYWLTAEDGGVFAFGDAGAYGSMGGRRLNAPVVGIAATPTGKGYWLAGRDGAVYAFGDARFAGSMGGRHLNAPVVGIAPVPWGSGYWLTAGDGGVYAYGDAQFLGSMGGQHLNSPVVAVTATPKGRGYWLFAADGGVFTFGDAPYVGGMVGRHLNTPITAGTRGPGGYWMLGADGGVFAFGPPYLGGVVHTPAPKYTLPVPRAKVTQAQLAKPHHDYAAADLPVWTGTPFYAMTSGTIQRYDNPSCGYGVLLTGDDGASYIYCHASKVTVSSGRVKAGTQLGLTGGALGAEGAGSSKGPHLHLVVQYPAGRNRCPQNLLVALYNGTPAPSPAQLPTSGCSY